MTLKENITKISYIYLIRDRIREELLWQDFHCLNCTLIFKVFNYLWYECVIMQLNGLKYK